MGRTQAGRPATHSSTGDNREFDFWLGEWDLSWGDGQRGTNSVYSDFDGRVVVESFDGRPSTELQGMSVSSFDEAAGTWRQTWVDNQGTFLTFAGGFADGRMELRSVLVPLTRMRWYDITPDSLEWAYERSPDGGTTWLPLWEISYRRVL
jgi:hypothetical protein